MPPPKAVKDRITKALGRKPNLGQSALQWHKDDPLFLEAVYCPICRRKIRGLVPHDQYPTRMIMVSLPGYEQITIEFDDGSAHVTPVCSTCATNLTPDDLDDLYAADLQDFETIQQKGGGTVNWQDHLTRKPTGYKRGI